MPVRYISFDESLLRLDHFLTHGRCRERDVKAVLPRQDGPTGRTYWALWGKQCPQCKVPVDVTPYTLPERFSSRLLTRAVAWDPYKTDENAGSQVTTTSTDTAASVRTVTSLRGQRRNEK